MRGSTCAAAVQLSKASASASWTASPCTNAPEALETALYTAEKTVSIFSVSTGAILSTSTGTGTVTLTAVTSGVSVTLAVWTNGTAAYAPADTVTATATNVTNAVTLAAANYEAKAAGVKRGLQLHEAKKLCPCLVILPSDYEAAPILRMLFDALFTPGQLYRSTLVWFGGLVSGRNRQPDLFEDTPAHHDYGKLDAAVDRINRRYGQHAVAPTCRVPKRSGSR